MTRQRFHDPPDARAGYGADGRDLQPAAADGGGYQLGSADSGVHAERVEVRLPDRFVVFLPFLLIDLLVSSVLMAMGMFMVPPVVISLPIKILMFVLIDGWNLVVRSILGSFH